MQESCVQKRQNGHVGEGEDCLQPLEKVTTNWFGECDRRRRLRNGEIQIDNIVSIRAMAAKFSEMVVMVGSSTRKGSST